MIERRPFGRTNHSSTVTLFGAAALARASQAAAQLFEATVRLPTGLSLRPALLPWALGTAAVITYSSSLAITSSGRA